MSATEWKFVPVEPTIEMVAALGFDGDVDVTIGHGAISAEIVSAYTAMLYAAPVPPSVESLLENWTPSDQKAFAKFRDEHFPGEMSSYAIQSLGSAWKDGQASAQPQPAAHLTIPGALEWDQLPGPVEIEYPEYSEQGMGCGLEDRGITDRYEAMRYGYDEALDQFARILDGYGPLYTHSGTHGVVGTHGADGESRVHGDDEQLPAPVEFEYPQYSEAGMGCGLEDRGITDRYEAMRYGFDEALDQMSHVIAGMGPLFAHADSAEVDQLRAQLANTEQSRRSFFDLSQDLEKRLAERDELLQMFIDNSDDGDVVELSRHALCASAAATKCESCGDWGHIETEDSAHDCPECGPSVVERAVEAGVMNAPAKPKACIECDQPYCHGVCVERGDQDYDRDQAAKGGCDE